MISACTVIESKKENGACSLVERKFLRILFDLQSENRIYLDEE